MEPKELIHAKKLKEEGDIKEAFKIILELENNNDLTPQQILSSKILKGKLLSELGQYQETFNLTDQILNESQQKGDLISSLDVLLIQAFSHIMMGNIKRSKPIIEQADKLYEKIKSSTKEDFRDKESFLIRMKANISFWRGETNRSLNLNKKAFELAKETNNKDLKSASLINIAEIYQQLRNYNEAIIYAKRALEIGYYPFIPYQLGILIDILLDKGDIDSAKFYFQQLTEYKEKEKTKDVDDL